MPPKIPTPVKLADELLVQIDLVAKETPEGNRSEVIREALRFYFKHRNQAADLKVIPQATPAPRIETQVQPAAELPRKETVYPAPTGKSTPKPLVMTKPTVRK